MFQNMVFKLRHCTLQHCILRLPELFVISSIIIWELWITSCLWSLKVCIVNHIVSSIIHVELLGIIQKVRPFCSQYFIWAFFLFGKEKQKFLLWQNNVELCNDLEHIYIYIYLKEHIYIFERIVKILKKIYERKEGKLNIWKSTNKMQNIRSKKSIIP